MGLLGWLSRPFAARAVDPVMAHDHAEHFRRLSQLFDALQPIPGSDQDRERHAARLLGMIRRFIDDARDHFEREQELMVSYGYAGRESHQHEHQSLLDDAEKTYARLAAGTTPLDHETITYFKGWLATHMQTQDKALEKFLHETRPVGKLSKIMVESNRH